MKPTFSMITLAMITCASVAQADIIVPQSEVTVSGAEATKIANLMVTGREKQSNIAQGTAKVNCVKKSKEANYTCVLKVLNENK